MKKCTWTLLIMLSVVFVMPVAASALDVKVKDEYSTGEVVVISISNSQPTVDVSNLTIQITKPNGAVVNLKPRHEHWNKANECFETYTIEMMGDYKISVQDIMNKESAATAFSAKLFTSSSMIFISISLAIFALCFVLSAKQRRQHAAT